MIHRLVSTLSELGGDPGTALCLQALPIRTHPLLHPVTVADILEEAIEVVERQDEDPLIDTSTMPIPMHRS